MPPAPDRRQQKSDLRRTMQTLRAEAFTQSPQAGLALRDVFLKNITLPSHSIIASYHASGSEINPAFLNDSLRQQGHVIALPRVVAKATPLNFHLYNLGDTLIPGYADIPEPRATAPLVEPDVLLVPLLAFDQKLNRLGYGGGFYDRTLNHLRHNKTILAIGLAFACQEVPEIPTSLHDIKLDKITTNLQTF